MKSLVIVQHGTRRLEPTELPVPDTLAGDEVLVRVEGCGICGTDHEQYAGNFSGAGRPLDYPLIPGHEPVGRVERIGADAALRMHIGVGNRIAIQPHAGCGTCRHCAAGQAPLCAHKRVYGFVPLAVGSGLWGGFSQYMVLKGNTVVHRLPHHLSIEDAVLFNPLGAGFEWVVALGGTTIGDDVLIHLPAPEALAAVRHLSMSLRSSAPSCWGLRSSGSNDASFSTSAMYWVFDALTMISRIAATRAGGVWAGKYIANQPLSS
jgi:threonine dehydrogenase-like Zn-dependent dehydrogenase